MTGLSSLVVSLMFAQSAVAGGPLHSLEGTVTGPTSARFERLQVIVRAPATRDSYRAHVGSDGSFTFRGLQDGIYEAEVQNATGDVILREMVHVPANMGLVLNLPEANPPRGPVSIYRLSHQVPGPAMKAYRKAAAASQDRDEAEAIKHLDRAIELDPGFVEALHRRGLLAFTQRDVATAERLLKQAAELDSASPALLADAAMAEYASSAYQACERFAALALRLDPANVKSHYLLALAMLQLGRPAEQAAAHLEKASGTFPKAAEILARIRERRKEVSTLK